MTPIIITLSLLIHSQPGRKNSGTDLGTGYGGTVCGFHTPPSNAAAGAGYTFYPHFTQLVIKVKVNRCVDP